MSPDARREALLATARIACALTLVSCGPKPVSVEEAPALTEPPAVTAAEAPELEPMPSPTDGHLAEHGIPSAEDVETCEASTEDLFARNRDFHENAPTPYSDEDKARLDALNEELKSEGSVGCCETLRSHHLATQLVPNDSEPIFHDDCCRVLNYMGPACTPWGPPTPPEMATRIV